VDRLATMMTLVIVPPYMGNCKLVMLSKNKTPTVSSIKDIRPIGLLSVLWKVMEKAFKVHFQDNKIPTFDTHAC